MFYKKMVLVLLKRRFISFIVIKIIYYWLFYYVCFYVFGREKMLWIRSDYIINVDGLIFCFNIGISDVIRVLVIDINFCCIYVLFYLFIGIVWVNG